MILKNKKLCTAVHKTFLIVITLLLYDENAGYMQCTTIYIYIYIYIYNIYRVVQWLVDASSVAASGCHRWLALLGERVSKMCKSHLAST